MQILVEVTGDPLQRPRGCGGESKFLAQLPLGVLLSRARTVRLRSQWAEAARRGVVGGDAKYGVDSLRAVRDYQRVAVPEPGGRGHGETRELVDDFQTAEGETVMLRLRDVKRLPVRLDRWRLGIGRGSVDIDHGRRAQLRQLVQPCGLDREVVRWLPENGCADRVHVGRVNSAQILLERCCIEIARPR